jgi:hypothetical protein
MNWKSKLDSSSRRKLGTRSGIQAQTLPTDHIYLSAFEDAYSNGVRSFCSPDEKDEKDSKKRDD